MTPTTKPDECGQYGLEWRQGIQVGRSLTALSCDAQDVLRRSVEENDPVQGIGCDDATGDRSKDAGHQFLCRFHALEQARVVDGNGGLVGKCDQQVEFSFGEQSRFDAVVGVHNADDLVFDA